MAILAGDHPQRERYIKELSFAAKICATISRNLETVRDRM